MRQIFTLRIHILIALLTITSVAHAGNLSEIEIFERCFKRMVRDVPATDDALWVKVKGGTLKGAAACLQLFDKARMTSNGRIANVNDVQARAIVRTFNDFHGSWFQQRITENGQTQGMRTFHLVADLEEPQLFVMRSLLGGKPYKSIVTDKVSLHGIRVRPEGKDNANSFQAQRLISYPGNIEGFTPFDHLRVAYRPAGENYQADIVPMNQIITSGELVGVKEMPVYRLPFVTGITAKVAQGSVDLNADAVRAAQKNVSVNENFGGGIVGSPVFMMTNANLPPNTKATAPLDENYMINRVLGARVYEDLLCHQLPTLSEADVRALLNPTSPHPFHQQATCMTCHAQVDPFAHTYRNFVSGLSGTRLQKDGAQAVGLSMYAWTKIPVTAGAKAYAEQTPEGYVRYRPFRATKAVSTRVTSLAQIGQALADSSDFYECAAKRYYQFFTGIDVPLQSLPAKLRDADPNAVAKLELDRKHQNFVLNLASQLRKDQSLRNLVSRILSSSQYKSRDFSSAVEAQ